MNKIVLFHGSPDKFIMPTYGKGEENTIMDEGFILPKVLILQRSGRFVDQTRQTALFISMNSIRKNLKFWTFRNKAFLHGLRN